MASFPVLSLKRMVVEAANLFIVSGNGLAANLREYTRI